VGDRGAAFEVCGLTHLLPVAGRCHLGCGLLEDAEASIIQNGSIAINCIGRVRNLFSIVIQEKIIIQSCPKRMRSTDFDMILLAMQDSSVARRRGVSGIGGTVRVTTTICHTTLIDIVGANGALAAGSGTSACRDRLGRSA
jgi:hypothetical protein